jgi:glucokinase
MENMNPQYAAGVDLGGTTITTVLVNGQGELLSQVKCLTEAAKGVDTVVSKIVESIKSACLQAHVDTENISTIGIGSPGPLSTKTGIVIDAPNLSNWVNVPLRDLVQKHFLAPVFLDNDANAAAYGEFWIGAGKGYRNLMVITLGTGIGGGMIIDGKLFRGPDDTAGEIGHIPILMDGPLCNCGNRGCLETLASATGLVNRAIHSLRFGVASLLRNLCENDMNKLTAKMVHEAALQGDKLAVELLRETGYYIGIASASIVNLLNPELIIIFGGLSGAGEFLFAPIRDEIKKRAFPTPAARVKVVPAILGNTAGAIGAAGIALAEVHPE